MKLSPNCYDIIPEPPSMQGTVERAAQAWRAFLELPQAAKDQFGAAQLQASIGYERKVGNGKLRMSSDTKENFDVTRDAVQQLLELPSSSSSSPAQHLLTASRDLLDAINPIATNYCQSLSARYNLESHTQAAGELQQYLRYLYYPPTPENTVVGEAHADHSGFTFHVYESTPGCQALDPVSRSWQAMPVEPESMIAFAGMQLQLVSGGEVKALCHEIRSVESTQNSGRLAIVCFNSFEDVAHYDRKTHGRLQEFEPGFNYDMSNHKFEQLFSVELA